MLLNKEKALLISQKWILDFFLSNYFYYSKLDFIFHAYALQFTKF